MESEFEPALRTEETPEARILIVDLPGFRKEDLKVHINNRGNLVISGERGVNEMEETTKVGGSLEKMKRKGHRFRKDISAPENLNYNGITAMFTNERLRVFLPLLRTSDQQYQDEVLAGGKPVQSGQSKVERPSPAGHEDSMKEQSGVAEDNQRARHPEAIRRGDDKEKASAAVEESKGLAEERKTEAPRHAQDFVHGMPAISKEAKQERSDDQSARNLEAIRPDDHKEKPVGSAGESKELVEGEKGAEAPKHAQDFVRGAPISKEPIQERSAVAKVEQSARYPDQAIRPGDHKAKPVAAARESKEIVKGEKAEAPKHAQDFVGGAPISKAPMQEQSAVAKVEQSARHPEAIQPGDRKAKPVGAAGEPKELVKGEKAEAPKYAQDFVVGAPISKDPIQERSAVAKVEQRATHPEAIRPDNDKAKFSAAAEELRKLLRGEKAEVPKQAQDSVGVGAPISESAVAKVEQSLRHIPEAIRPGGRKAKPVGAAGESIELVKGGKEEEPKHAKDFVGGAPISKDPVQERSAVAKVEQGARHPEAIQPGDRKAKPVGAAGEPKELVKGEKAEAPKYAQDFVGGAPISKDPIQEPSAYAKVKQSVTHSEAIRPDNDKAKPNAAVEELRKILQGVTAEVPKHAQDSVGGGAPISEIAGKEQSAVAQNDQISESHPAKSIVAPGESSELLEEKKKEAAKHGKDFVHGEPPIPTHAQAQALSAEAGSPKQEELKVEQEVEEDDEESDEVDGEEVDSDEDEGDECSLSNDEFPERIIQIPRSTGRSMFSKDKVLIASTVLAVSLGLYVSYILSSQSSDCTP